MMIRNVIAVMALATLAMANGSAFAGDPRIRTVTYAPDKVFALVGHYGYQISIELPEGERVENIAIGDSLAWQVTPNRRGDVVIVKPVDLGEPTNMTILTAERRYAFELSARHRNAETRSAEITYVLRIKNSDAPGAEAPQFLSEAEEPILPEEVNSNYTYAGSPANLPSRVYDDGASTVFQWPEGARAPAIFVVAPDGKDSIVNYSYSGEAIIVHQTAARFVLRNGSEVTTIFNESYAPPEPGPNAPRLRKEKRRGVFGRDRGAP